MPKIKLEASVVPMLTCPPDRDYVRYHDDAISNFVVEVRASGVATYALRYKDEYGKQRQYKIGRVDALSFAEAKREAIRVKSRTVVGKNPQEERQISRRISTIAELSARYLEYVKTYKRSHDIDERYLRIHILPKWGKRHLNQLTQTEIMDWLASKVDEGYAQATTNRWHVIIGHMYRMAKRWNMPGAEVNPLEGAKLKEPDNRMERFLSPAETQRLKEAVEQSPNFMLRYIVALALLTGCRKRELLDAKWDDVSLERKTWRIPFTKSGKPRFVPLSEDAIAVLRSIPRIEGSPYLVPNPKTGKPFYSIYNSWHHARVKAGLADVRMHDLRHSAASNLVNAGQSLYVVARVLGHAQTKTTERYAHLAADTLLSAVNAASQVSGTTWGDGGEAGAG